MCLNNLLGSTGAGVGNLISEGNRSKILDVFWELFAIRFFVAGICVFALYHLLPAFISLWLGPQYILASSVLIILLLNFFIGMVRGATDQFLFGYGLFYDTWAPIAESIIYVLVAIAGGSIWGLEGILSGGTISLVAIVGIWKPYFLFSKGFELSIWKYWKGVAVYVLLTIISFLSVRHILLFLIDPLYPTYGWHYWIIYACLVTGSFAVVHLILLYLFTKGMRSFVKRMLKWK